mgnify:CR=1 FL=1|jgi:hypothetical protein
MDHPLLYHSRTSFVYRVPPAVVAGILYHEVLELLFFWPLPKYTRNVVGVKLFFRIDVFVGILEWMCHRDLLDNC